MKKRILAVLLMVVILAALFAGLSVTAAAANDVSGDTISGYMVAYTMKNGDTVLNICKKLGIDFYKNQAMISKVNNIGDYSTLPVGKVLWLPATSVGSASDYYTLKSHKVVSGDDTNTLLSKYGIASTDAMLSKVNNNLASPVVGTTLTFPVYTGSSSNKMADNTTAVIGGAAAAAGTATGISTTTGGTAVTSGNVAYYLVAYTMQPGDTVGAVCTSIGINFNQNSALISRINGITNYNRIPVGRTILIPSGTATGTSYSVIAHQIAAGETANDICTSYGVSLANNLTLIKGLNNTNNLNYIQAGGILYVPVAGTSPTPGPGPSPTPTPGTAYKLSKDDCDNGSFVLKVGGAEATTATEGSTVTIVCNGAAGYAQKTITAHMTGDTSKKVTVTNNTFVMPDYNVTVKVTFAKATMYAIDCKSASNGSYELMVDEKVVTDKTYAGAAVTINTKPNPNFVVSEIQVYKTADDTVKVPVTNGKFTMPQYKVTVEVTFKPASNYEYPISAYATPSHGSFEIRCDATTVVSKLASGQLFWVACKADSGYKQDTITLRYPALDADGNQITKKEIVSGTITMPSFADKIPLSDREVKVEVNFIEDKTFTITIKADTFNSGNGVLAQVNGATVTKAEPGRTVVVVPDIKKAGYELTSIAVTDEGGNPISGTPLSDPSSAAHFTMPSKNVIITPTYASAGNYEVVYSIKPTGKATITYSVDAITYAVAEGTPVSFKSGKTVNLTIKPNNVNNFKVKSVKAVYQYDGEDVEVKISGNNFTMPASKVAITVELEHLKHGIETKLIKDGSEIADDGTAGTFTYIVSGKTVTNAAEDDNVVIKTEMSPGYKVKNIKVTYKDADGKEQTVPVSEKNFKMPAYKATVTITVDEGTGVFFNINIADTDNGSVHAENDSHEVITQSEEGKKVQVIANPDPGFKVKDIKVKSGGVLQSLDSDNKFDMPGAPVNITVTFEAVTYDITPSASNSTLVITNEYGESIHDAKAGATVKFAVTPKEGYKFDKVTVTNEGGNILHTFDLSEGSFEMPAEKVTVTAYVLKIAADLKINKFEFADFVNGSVSLKVNGSDASFPATVKEGDTIVINAEPFSGYKVVSITVHNMKSGTTTVVSVETGKFIMPNENVQIEVIFALG
ncbi:MAG: LysM peptidoglycan-binding domain-containing protein [Oscillospiraceae bacterium]|nr:LysM peptidoglycan-binding domain-containing protein [Oscillospiraceae bacterium]